MDIKHKYDVQYLQDLAMLLDSTGKAFLWIFVVPVCDSYSHTTATTVNIVLWTVLSAVSQLSKCFVIHYSYGRDWKANLFCNSIPACAEAVASSRFQRICTELETSL